jgi:hypothetical protein
MSFNAEVILSGERVKEFESRSLYRPQAQPLSRPGPEPALVKSGGRETSALKGDLMGWETVCVNVTW